MSNNLLLYEKNQRIRTLAAIIWPVAIPRAVPAPRPARAALSARRACRRCSPTADRRRRRRAPRWRRTAAGGRRFSRCHAPRRVGVRHEQDVALGTSSRRIRLVNEDGIDLGIDKSGSLVPTFETRPREDIAALVRATTAVLRALETAGVRPFVAYGTLLGAVREGTVLGHDSDADVAYVSDATSPVDVVLESFRLQREVGRLGLATLRYSGAAFKVLVPEGDGVERGLDVFAGFLEPIHQNTNPLTKCIEHFQLDVTGLCH